MTLELEPYWDATPKRKPSPRRDDCCCYFCSVPTSCLILCNSIDCSCQAPVFSALSWTFLLRFMSIESVMLSNHLILSHSLLFLPSIFPSIRVFASGGQSIGASASTLPMNIQGWFPLGLTGFISWLFRDSQESSPTPQLESINSLALSLLYGPTLTSICEYWKNYSFDCMHLCRQSDVSAF